ncbi:MAG: hypothetical protein R2811_05050 [Flavobacteriales bacterium]
MNRIEAAITGWDQAVIIGGDAKADAYYSLCWVLVTSNGEELKEFCWKYWASFDRVPTPLIVLGARLLAHCYRNEIEVVDKCKQVFALYCDPEEEQEILNSL